MNKWSDTGIKIPFGRTSGKIKTICPECQKGSRKHKNDKSLSVNLDDGLYKCHYCGWSGSIGNENRYLYNYTKMNKKVYQKPQWNNKTDISDDIVKWFEDERKISQNTLKTLRITEGPGYSRKENRRVKAMQFNYFRNGELINVKSRTKDKCFSFVPECELILYNIDSIKGQKEAIITEGEIDAATFIECGYKSVVSVPNGANGTDYLDNDIERFDNIETIYIAVDTDEKGICFRNELIRRFGPEKCKIVTYGDGCKDANEHFIKYGQKSLKTCIDEAQEIKVEGIFSLSDIRQEADLLFQGGLKQGYTIGHFDFDKLISFETGRLCIVTGIPSHGKSEFVDEIVVKLNLRYGLKFAYFSPENHPLSYLIAKLTSKFTGKKFDKDSLKPSEYENACMHIENNFSFIYPEEDFGIDSILEKATYLVNRKGIKGLIIDPYNTIEHQIPAGMSETNYISTLLSKLVTFARQKDVLIFLVAHPRKMEIKNGVPVAPNLYDVNGSANFYNKTDYGFTVYRDSTLQQVRIDIHKVKFKHLGKCGSAYFTYNYINGRYTPLVSGRIGENDNTNYLDSLYDNRQSSIDFDLQKTYKEMENEFLSDVTSEDKLPF